MTSATNSSGTNCLHPIEPKTVRFLVRDGEATDTSSEEDCIGFKKEIIGRQFKYEVLYHSCCGQKVVDRGVVHTSARQASRAGECYEAAKLKKPRGNRRRKQTNQPACDGVIGKYRGIRLRDWGKWCAQIRDPTSNKRLWLGTFRSPEEAAMAYDREAIRIRGKETFTNFPYSIYQTEESGYERKSPAIDEDHVPVIEAATTVSATPRNHTILSNQESDDTYSLFDEVGLSPLWNENNPASYSHWSIDYIFDDLNLWCSHADLSNDFINPSEPNYLKPDTDAGGFSWVDLSKDNFAEGLSGSCE